eukprot:RCo012667
MSEKSGAGLMAASREKAHCRPCAGKSAGGDDPATKHHLSALEAALQSGHHGRIREAFVDLGLRLHHQNRNLEAVPVFGQFTVLSPSSCSCVCCCCLPPIVISG